ncbi:hypothetical protein ACHHYP_10435 [Achlya hypogyna]|uniref:Uncharacterized protein n=1 Tax=Achlya hypogyna TaxID=1202772 RepID=A0A1V9YLG5_ACHHY|nr:hypothetical protein ACHHYP_10435 [Achlya hypogyna]
MDAKRATDKREYNRLKQRAFRKKVEAELADLHKTIYHLETALRTARPQRTGGPLPWADVAAAFAQATEASLHTNRALRCDLERNKELARRMHAWLGAPGNHRVPDNRYSNWAPVGLPDGWEARQHAFRWITDRLFAHAEPLLHFHGLYRGARTTFGEIAVHVSTNGAHEYCTKYQRLLSAPLERVVAAYKVIGSARGGDFMLAGRHALDEDITSLMEEDIVYSQGVFTRAGVAWIDNKVWRTYVDRDRLVIVSQNVADDSKHPLTPMQRFRCNVVVAERINASSTLVRQLNINSHAFTKDGFVSPAIEAQQFNVDVAHIEAAEDQLALLAQHIRTVRNQMFCRSMDQSLDAALRGTNSE